MNAAPGSVGPHSYPHHHQQQQQQQHQLNSNNVSISNQNNADYSMNIDQSPLVSGNVKQEPKQQQATSDKPSQLASKKEIAESTVTSQQLRPSRLKPLDNMPILNKKKFLKSNLDLNFYINSLCFSLNLSDTFNNCYRDINFDSCSLCVCNMNYLKGLDYSIYICNDLFNSNVDYYDYNDQIDGTGVEASGEATRPQQQGRNNFAGLYIVNNGSSEADSKQTRQQKEAAKQQQETHNFSSGNQQNHNQSFQPDSSSQMQQQSQQTCTCGFSAIVNRQILSTKAQAVSLDKFLRKVCVVINEFGV